MIYQTLSSGMKIPALGLGTWLSTKDEVYNAVIKAIEVGYRHIDTAFCYQNEAEIGRALKACFERNLVKREDLFVTTKLWNTFHNPKDVRDAAKKSLELLQLDYVDMFLIHWPMGYINNGELFPKDSNGKFIYSDDDYVDTWKAMELCVKDGLVKHIGLSNFNVKQIQRVWDMATVKPSNLQVECHPYFQQNELVDYCKKMGIIFTCYSPFANPERPWKKDTDPKVFEDDRLKVVGDKYGKSNAQVTLRYFLQRGLVVIPKSVNPDRIAQNFNVFDFELTDDDMKTIKSIDCGFRGCCLEWIADHPHHPFPDTKP